MINTLLILIDTIYNIYIKNIEISIKRTEKIYLAKNLYVSLYIIISKYF